MQTSSTLQTSKTYLVINEGLNRIFAHSGSFEKKIGDIITIDGNKYKVFQLHVNMVYAKQCLNLFSFGTHLTLAKTNLGIK